MKLALIGFMGSSKTTTGKALAKKLGLQFLDSDELVIKETGKTINEIFTHDGQEHFRQLETKAIISCANLDNVVLSLGGGAILDAQNINVLKQNDYKIIFLSATLSTISSRLKNDNSRPLIKDAAKLYDFRLPLYKQHANITVIADNKPTIQIIKEILQQIT